MKEKNSHREEIEKKEEAERYTTTKMFLLSVIGKN